MSGFDSVRSFYGVPARRGAEVKFTGQTCTILSSDGQYLYLRRTADDQRLGPCHPTWRMDYGDGRDYGAETNARIHRFNELVNESKP